MGVARAEAPAPAVIAFDREPDEGGDCDGEIRTVNADGTGERLLVPRRPGTCSPRFSPDGSRLVFSRRRASGGQPSLFVANADGSEPRRITFAAAGDYEAAWSPDGQRLVYERYFNQKHWGLYVVDADGRNERRLTDVRDFEGTPDWSPDGRTIAFASYRHPGARGCRGCAALYRMPAGGGRVRRITRRRFQSLMPAWSPDGRSIAWARARSIDSDVYDLYVMNADTTGARLVLRDAEQPSWSPDGGTLAVVRGGIWTVSADGTNARRLTPPEDLDADPTWRRPTS